MSYFLPHLPSGWHVDQAILNEEERIVCIRFGHDWDPVCMQMDEALHGIAEKMKNYAIFYVVDITEVPDFNVMVYACLESNGFLVRAVRSLLRHVLLQVSFPKTTNPDRNKHILVDLGTGNNNKINWALDNKSELIDIVETVYRGARKGRGLVISPKDYSTKYKY